MRWYDVEPDVYMAISMIECSYGDAQTDYAKYIIRSIITKKPIKRRKKSGIM